MYNIIDDVPSTNNQPDNNQPLPFDQRSPQRPDNRRMTRAEKLAALERIIQRGAPSDRVRAIIEHNKLSGDTAATMDGITPDPAYLAEFFRLAQEQGLTARELAERANAGKLTNADKADDAGQVESKEDGGDV